LSVALEVQPQSSTRLSSLLDQLREQEEAAPHGIPESYDRLKREVPAMHLMSMNLFPGHDYDPLFVIEANIDGAPGLFWAQLEAAIGDDLRKMLRCCKRPLDDSAPLFDAVTAPGSCAPIAPYLEARTLTPSAFHQGNRGLPRDRILTERDLYLATREEIATANEGGESPYRGVSPQAIHDRLRAAMLPQFSWLGDKAPARITAGERIMDRLKVVAFVCLALFVLSIPGLILAVLVPTWWRFVIIVAIATAVFAIPLIRMGKPLPGTEVKRRSGNFMVSLRHRITSLAHPIGLLLRVLPLLAFYTVLAGTIGAVMLMPIMGEPFDVTWPFSVRNTVLGLVGIVFSVTAILFWLRYLERRDSSQDAPPIDERTMRDMVRREDWITQSHMGSIVNVKPGILRSAVFRAGHLGLGLVLRASATTGYLGSMRTIHFAHWAFVNNGHRLLFFSNFDHSWESYLDDFIEKAHGGLTLAWGSCVGFPPTRFLVKDGASHGLKFKNWARHSMTVSRFWFSAYRDLTTDQIERNYRIADGLRKKTLSAEEATQWANDL
jgi:membrane protein implicated in regulation of membrane protease activity